RRTGGRSARPAAARSRTTHTSGPGERHTLHRRSRERERCGRSGDRSWRFERTPGMLRPMKFDLGILASQPVPAIVEQVKLAEALGFEPAWITDTHLVCRELWVTLAACALGTSRIRLGPGITVPHTRHISVTASALATLEEMAEGRVVV